ncbi:MAG: hypothetical protein EOP49_21460 [Sphingobacteriales bacterium]|nr:MAG: hypothetical protein EOP49_21460 [Sphingobacteriales bacterium]
MKDPSLTPGPRLVDHGVNIGVYLYTYTLQAFSNLQDAKQALANNIKEFKKNLDLSELNIQVENESVSRYGFFVDGRAVKIGFEISALAATRYEVQICFQP